MKLIYAKEKIQIQSSVINNPVLEFIEECAKMFGMKWPIKTEKRRIFKLKAKIDVVECTNLICQIIEVVLKITVKRLESSCPPFKTNPK